MQARQVPSRVHRKSKSDDIIAPTTSNAKICCRRKFKIIMEGKNGMHVIYIVDSTTKLTGIIVSFYLYVVRVHGIVNHTISSCSLFR